MCIPRAARSHRDVHTLAGCAADDRDDHVTPAAALDNYRPVQQPEHRGIRSPVHTLTMTDRTSLKLTDERKREFDRAAEIVAAGPDDDPPRSKVIDAALRHLIESKENIEDARDDVDPTTIQKVANTSVLGLRYRTRVESRFR